MIRTGQGPQYSIFSANNATRHNISRINKSRNYLFSLRWILPSGWAHQAGTELCIYVPSFPWRAKKNENDSSRATTMDSLTARSSHRRIMKRKDWSSRKTVSPCSLRWKSTCSVPDRTAEGSSPLAAGATTAVFLGPNRDRSKRRREPPDHLGVGALGVNAWLKANWHACSRTGTLLDENPKLLKVRCVSHENTIAID